MTGAEDGLPSSSGHNPRILLALAGAAFLLVLAFAVLPVEQKSVTYEWSPERDGASVPLLLSERVPDQFDVRLPCPAVTQGSGTVLRTSANSIRQTGLTVRQSTDAYTANAPGSAPLHLEASGDCTHFELTFQRDSQELALHEIGGAGGRSVSMTAYFEIASLHWTGVTSDEVRATILTRPSAEVRNSSLQRVLLVLIVALAAVSVTIVLRGRPTPEVASSRALSARPDRFDWAAVGISVVTMIIDTPRVDDGGILARARSGAGSVLTSHLSTRHEGFALPQRGLYESILGTAVGWSDVVLILRLPALVAGLFIWFAFRRLVLPRLVRRPDAYAVVVTLLLTYTVYVVAWLPTLRPEPIVAALNVAALAVVANRPQRPRSWPYLLAPALAGIAISLHAVGLVVAITLLPLLPGLLRDVRRAPSLVLAGLAWGASIAAMVLLLGMNLPFLLEQAANYGANPGANPVAHAARYRVVLTGYPVMIISFSLATVAYVAIVASLVRPQRGRAGRRQLVLLGQAMAPIAFMVTPTMQGWHLAVLITTGMVGMSLVASWIDSNDVAIIPTVPIIITYATAISIVAAVLGDRTRLLGPFAYRSVDSDYGPERVPWLVGPEASPVTWLLLFIAVAAAAVTLSNRRKTGPGSPVLTAALSVAVLVPVTMHLATPLIDAASVEHSDWTFVRQSVGGLVSAEATCLLLSETRLTAERRGELEIAAMLDADEPLVVTGPRVTEFLLPCTEPVTQSEGRWKQPDFVLGSLTDGQERIGVEVPLAEAICTRGRSGDLGELCWYTPVEPSPTMQAVSVEWLRRDLVP